MGKFHSGDSISAYFFISGACITLLTCPGNKSGNPLPSYDAFAANELRDLTFLTFLLIARFL